MAGFNGSGVFLRTYNWTNDANAAINIRADRMDTEDTGFASGLSNVICKDGQTTITANLPMAGFLHTNVGNASMRTQYAALGQVQDSSVLLIGSIAGTNTITGNLTPAITAYVTGQRYSFIVGVTNTGAVTININAVGAVALLKKSSAGLIACVAGDLVATQEYRVFYDGTQFQFSPTPPPAQALNPFSDAIALVKNSADNTKLALFSASSLTTGTTRTYTMPDKNGTVAMLSDIPVAVVSVISVKRQVFSASGTYTPSAGMLYCDAEIWGAGGGGGGVTTTAGSVGAGGGAGAYCKKLITAAAIGVSKAITIGAAGTAGATAGGTGGTGGTTTLGVILSATGGGGGQGTSSGSPLLGGTGGTATGGDINLTGSSANTIGGNVATGEISGAGASTALGGYGISQNYTVNAIGQSALANTGSGGGGAAANGTANAGGAGGSGYVVVTEYCSQ
jgi:hypothetical protein